MSAVRQFHAHPQAFRGEPEALVFRVQAGQHHVHNFAPAIGFLLSMIVYFAPLSAYNGYYIYREETLYAV